MTPMFPGKRGFTRRHFVHQHAQRKQVRPRFERLSSCLLRRHMRHSPHRCPRTRQVLLHTDRGRRCLSRPLKICNSSGYLRESEIQDFRVSPLGHEKVRRLYVSVNELEKIIQKLMVKKVGERYQSAAELRAALKGLRAKRSSQSVPAVAVVGHWMRRPAVWLPNRSAGSIGPGGRRSRLQALRASAMGERRGDSASGGVLDRETQKTQVIPGMEEGDFTDRWTEDGQGLVVTKSTPWGGEIWRLDVGTRKRTLLLRMELSDKAGSNFDLRMLYAEKSKTYAYDVRRILSELYGRRGWSRRRRMRVLGIICQRNGWQ